MLIKQIPHGFTYVYRKDAHNQLTPANRDWVFQNYDDARAYLVARADQRYCYYLSEVPYP